MGCGHIWTSRFSATGAGDLLSSLQPVTANPARTLTLRGVAGISPARWGCAGNMVPAKGKAFPQINVFDWLDYPEAHACASMAAMSEIARSRTSGSSREGMKPCRCQNSAASSSTALTNKARPPIRRDARTQR